MNEEIKRKVRKKFDVAYIIAKEDIAFSTLLPTREAWCRPR